LERTRLPFAAGGLYEPQELERLFVDVGDYLSFVGGVVIRRDVWNARAREPYFGMGFIHAAVVFQEPLPEPAFVLAEPLITIRYGDALYMRSSRYFEIWMFIWPNLIWSFAHFSDSAKCRVCRKEPWRRKRELLFLRAKGAFSIKEYSGWLESRLNRVWDRIAAQFIARLPGEAANFAALAYCYLIRRPSGAFLLDLVKSPYYFARAFKRVPSSSIPKKSMEPVPVSGKSFHA
jgi:hypothetical protein